MYQLPGNDDDWCWNKLCKHRLHVIILWTLTFEGKSMKYTNFGKLVYNVKS